MSYQNNVSYSLIMHTNAMPNHLNWPISKVTMLLKRIFALLTIAIAFSLMSCKKEGSDKNKSNFSYVQTSCADVWGYGRSHEESLMNCVKYLSDNGIVVENYYVNVTPLAIICSACPCVTGIVYKVFVNEQYTPKMLALGFVQP
jgi:hypothetical protein